MKSWTVCIYLQLFFGAWLTSHGRSGMSCLNDGKIRCFRGRVVVATSFLVFLYIDVLEREGSLELKCDLIQTWLVQFLHPNQTSVHSLDVMIGC